MIGKVTCRELTLDEVASQCDAWREFCLFMEWFEDDEAEPPPLLLDMLNKFRELRDKFGGPNHPPKSSKETGHANRQ